MPLKTMCQRLGDGKDVQYRTQGKWRKIRIKAGWIGKDRAVNTTEGINERKFVVVFSVPRSHEPTRTSVGQHSLSTRDAGAIGDCLYNVIPSDDVNAKEATEDPFLASMNPPER